MKFEIVSSSSLPTLLVLVVAIATRIYSINSLYLSHNHHDVNQNKTDLLSRTASTTTTTTTMPHSAADYNFRIFRAFFGKLWQTRSYEDSITEEDEEEEDNDEDSDSDKYDYGKEGEEEEEASSSYLTTNDDDDSSSVVVALAAASSKSRRRSRSSSSSSSSSGRSSRSIHRRDLTASSEASLMDSNDTNDFLTQTQTFFTVLEQQKNAYVFDSSMIITILIGFLLYSLTIWTIIGNIIVCVIVLTNKQLKQGGMSNFLIGNLALSDLLLGLTVLPFSATYATFKTWMFGKILCDLWLSIDVLCSTASIWALLVISLDRYIATNHPIRYRKQKNSIKTAIIYCTVSWLISIIISLGPLFFISSDGSDEPPSSSSSSSPNGGSGGSQLNMNNGNSSRITSTMSPSTSHSSKKSGLRKIENSTEFECVLFQTPSFVILSSLGSFYLPLLLMIGLYTGVFLKIRQQSKMKFKKKKQEKKKKPEGETKSTKVNLETTATSTQMTTLHPNLDESMQTILKSNENLNSRNNSPKKQGHSSKKTSSLKSSVNPSANNNTNNNNNSSNNKKQTGGVARRISLLKRPNSSSISSSEARITKTLGIIMGVFVVCWLPFFLIYNIRSQLSDPDSISGNTMDFFLWLGYFNSALNPILYAILNANFRNAFKDILACRCCLPHSNRSLSRLSSVNNTNNSTTTVMYANTSNNANSNNNNNSSHTKHATTPKTNDNIKK